MGIIVVNMGLDESMSQSLSIVPNEKWVKTNFVTEVNENVLEAYFQNTSVLLERVKSILSNLFCSIAYCKALTNYRAEYISLHKALSRTFKHNLFETTN